VRIDATVTAVLSFAPAAVKLTHARSPRARSPGPGRVLAAVPAAVIVTVSTQASLSLSMPLTDHDHFVASAAILASVSESTGALAKLPQRFLLKCLSRRGQAPGGLVEARKAAYGV
jgi:hypothetical protein